MITSLIYSPVSPARLSTSAMTTDPSGRRRHFGETAAELATAVRGG